jgi:MerR family transcriptional regulator/heat shock protein HspR
MSEQHFLEPHDQGRTWSWSSRPRPQSDDEPRGSDYHVDDADTPLYVISVAAELADLHPQPLRAYERAGLITPARTEGGTRRFSQRDIDRLRFIRTLTQDEGLNLAGVRIVLDLGEKLESSRRRVTELEEMVRVLAERIDDRPAADRYQIVKAPASNVEVHPFRRRTGQRGSNPVQRARPVHPPERHAADA